MQARAEKGSNSFGAISDGAGNTVEATEEVAEGALLAGGAEPQFHLVKPGPKEHRGIQSYGNSVLVLFLAPVPNMLKKKAPTTQNRKHPWPNMSQGATPAGSYKSKLLQLQPSRQTAVPAVW